MDHLTLPEVALLLAAMAIAAPLARALGIGSVLGYLLAGIALGPNGVRHVFSTADAREFLEVAEFGIVPALRHRPRTQAEAPLGHAPGRVFSRRQNRWPRRRLSSAVRALP